MLSTPRIIKFIQDRAEKVRKKRESQVPLTPADGDANWGSTEWRKLYFGPPKQMQSKIPTECLSVNGLQLALGNEESGLA